jgi:hypothetical protein
LLTIYFCLKLKNNNGFLFAIIFFKNVDFLPVVFVLQAVVAGFQDSNKAVLTIKKTHSIVAFFVMWMLSKGAYLNVTSCSKELNTI